MPIRRTSDVSFLTDHLWLFRLLGLCRTRLGSCILLIYIHTVDRGCSSSCIGRVGSSRGDSDSSTTLLWFYITLSLHLDDLFRSLWTSITRSLAIRRVLERSRNLGIVELVDEALLSRYRETSDPQDSHEYAGRQSVSRLVEDSLQACRTASRPLAFHSPFQSQWIFLGLFPPSVQQPASKTGGRQCSCSSRYDYVELRRTLRRVTAAGIRYRRARPRVWYVAEERQLRISDLRAAKAALSPSCLQYLLAAVDPCP
jgi:hypothetical protein